MKFIIVLAFLLCILVVYVQAQGRCTPPRNQNCREALNVGRGGRGCQGGENWYHRNGQCLKMQYRGCGGNGNRYCSKADCERKCRRSG